MHKKCVFLILGSFFLCTHSFGAKENETYVDNSGDKITVLDTALRMKIKKNNELNVSTLYDSSQSLENYKEKYTIAVLPENVNKFGIYKVQKGDQLKRISQKLYGTQKRWQEIQVLNEEMLAGKNLRPGMKLKYLIEKGLPNE